MKHHRVLVYGLKIFNLFAFIQKIINFAALVPTEKNTDIKTEKIKL